MKEFVAIVFVNVSCRSTEIALNLTVHVDLQKYRAYGHEFTNKAHTTGLRTGQIITRAYSGFCFFRRETNVGHYLTLHILPVKQISSSGYLEVNLLNVLVYMVISGM